MLYNHRLCILARVCFYKELQREAVLLKRQLDLKPSLLFFFSFIWLSSSLLDSFMQISIHNEEKSKIAVNLDTEISVPWSDKQFYNIIVLLSTAYTFFFLSFFHSAKELVSCILFSFRLGPSAKFSWSFTRLLCKQDQFVAWKKFLGEINEILNMARLASGITHLPAGRMKTI